MGGLAQLARAPALHAGGHRFDSDILHNFLMKIKIKSSLTYWKYQVQFKNYSVIQFNSFVRLYRVNVNRYLILLLLNTT